MGKATASAVVVASVIVIQCSLAVKSAPSPILGDLDVAETFNLLTGAYGYGNRGYSGWTGPAYYQGTAGGPAYYQGPNPYQGPNSAYYPGGYYTNGGPGYYPAPGPGAPYTSSQPPINYQNYQIHGGHGFGKYSDYRSYV